MGRRMAMPRKITTQANVNAMSPEARVMYQIQGVSAVLGREVMVVVADGTVLSSGSVFPSISVPSYQPSESVSTFEGSVPKRVFSPVSVSPSRSESRTSSVSGDEVVCVGLSAAVASEKEMNVRKTAAMMIKIVRIVVALNSYWFFARRYFLMVGLMCGCMVLFSTKRAGTECFLA